MKREDDVSQGSSANRLVSSCSCNNCVAGLRENRKKSWKREVGFLLLFFLSSTSPDSGNETVGVQKDLLTVDGVSTWGVNLLGSNWRR